MPFDNTKAAEIDLILHAAADRIERDGWCQGSFEYAGRVCMVAAICDVAGDAFLRGEGIIYLEDRIGTQNLMAWNDDPGRTQEQVVTALRGEG